MSFKWQYWTTNITAVHYWVCKNANNYILGSIRKSQNKYLVWSLDEQKNSLLYFWGFVVVGLLGRFTQLKHTKQATRQLNSHFMYIYIWLHCRDGGEAGGWAGYLWDFDAKLEVGWNARDSSDLHRALTLVCVCVCVATVYVYRCLIFRNHKWTTTSLRFCERRNRDNT